MERDLTTEKHLHLHVMRSRILIISLKKQTRSKVISTVNDMEEGTCDRTTINHMCTISTRKTGPKKALKSNLEVKRTVA